MWTQPVCSNQYQSMTTTYQQPNDPDVQRSNDHVIQIQPDSSYPFLQYSPAHLMPPMVNQALPHQFVNYVPTPITLPPIELPTFDGNILKYRAFIQMFSSVMDSNTAISNAVKLVYLQSLVKGEAQLLIQHLPRSSENYTVARDILHFHYGNTDMLAAKLFRQLEELPQVQSDCVSANQHFWVQATTTLLQLKEIEPGHDNVTLSHMLIRKLPRRYIEKLVEESDNICRLKASTLLEALNKFIQHDLLVNAIFNYDKEKYVTKVQEPEELHNYEQGNCHDHSSYSTFQLPPSPRQFMHPVYHQQQPEFKLQDQSCEVTGQCFYSNPETSNTSQTLGSTSSLLHPQETTIQPAIPFSDNHDADSTSQTYPDSTVPETYKSDQIATPQQTSTVVDQKSIVSYCTPHPTPLQPLVHQKSTMSESSQWMSQLITQFALVIMIIALLQIASCAVQFIRFVINCVTQTYKMIAIRLFSHEQDLASSGKQCSFNVTLCFSAGSASEWIHWINSIVRQQKQHFVSFYKRFVSRFWSEKIQLQLQFAYKNLPPSFTQTLIYHRLPP